MAFIEELGLERIVKPIDGVRDRLGLARAVKVVDRWGDVCFRCRYCRREFDISIWSKNEYRDHVQSCKRTQDAIQKICRSDPKKIRHEEKRLNAICEEIANRNHLYLHQNGTDASGIGEFASNCTTFLGYGILRILEGGLISYKMDCLYSFIDYLRWNEEVSRTLLENPDAHFLSSINDILLISKSRYDTSRLLEVLGRVIWSCVLSDIVRIYEKLSHSDKPHTGWHFLNFNPKIFKQLSAISRSLALSNNHGPGTNAYNLPYDILIIIPFLWDSTNIFGEEIETDYRQKLYNTQKRTFDFNKVAHASDLVKLMNEHIGALSYFSQASQERDSPLEFGWHTYLQREIALQLFRKHIEWIYAPHSDYKPNFGIMSCISPYLITVDSGEEEIRSGICDLTMKFLSVAKKHINEHGFQDEVFRDIFEAISLLERFNYNTEVGDSILSQWLTKDYPYFESITIPSTQNYCMKFQEFRKFSLVEAFSQRCRAILNKPLVLKHLAEWLGISSLETCGLAWEDLDPENNWKNGFLHTPSPPKGEDMLEYCSYCKRWRIIEEYRFEVELEKLYGFNHLLRRRGYYHSDVLVPVRVKHLYYRLFCQSFHPIKDWQIHLQWEEREILIKNMIKENLRKTRPDIMNADNIVAQSVLDSSTQGTSASDTDLDTANDKIIHALKESQSSG